MNHLMSSYGLNEIELNECSKLNEYSENLIYNHFNIIQIYFGQIQKNNFGYIIYRYNNQYKFIIKINISDDQVELKKSIQNFN